MSTAPRQWLFNLVYAFLSLQVRLEEVYTTFEVQLVTCLAFCSTLEDWSRLWQMSGRNQVQVKRYAWMRCHVLGSNSFLALRTIDKLFNWTEDHPRKLRLHVSFSGLFGTPIFISCLKAVGIEPYFLPSQISWCNQRNPWKHTISFPLFSSTSMASNRTQGSGSSIDSKQNARMLGSFFKIWFC